MKLYGLMSSYATSGLSLQSESGSMPTGHNGPRRHKDTPVRTSAHWALIFLKGFQINGDPRLKEAALMCCRYLMTPAASQNNLFLCRQEPGKDNTNNLIGQAWAMEALAIAGDFFGEEALLEKALGVCKKHRFHKRFNLWYKADTNSKSTHLCRTLNQQIMFAGMALYLGRKLNDRDVETKGRNFFNALHTLSRFKETGLVHHKLFLPLKDFSIHPLYLKSLLKQGVEKYSRYRVSLGYLSFILYALALAHHLNPAEAIWHEKRFKEWLQLIIDYILVGFPYGWREDPASFRWSYNPTGLEVCFALHQFAPLLGEKYRFEKNKRWLELQLEGYYDFQSHLMNRNTNDPAILMARFYEAIWLPDIELNPDMGSTQGGPK